MYSERIHQSQSRSFEPRPAKIIFPAHTTAEARYDTRLTPSPVVSLHSAPVPVHFCPPARVLGRVLVRHAVDLTVVKEATLVRRQELVLHRGEARSRLVVVAEVRAEAERRVR